MNTKRFLLTACILIGALSLPACQNPTQLKPTQREVSSQVEETTPVEENIIDDDKYITIVDRHHEILIPKNPKKIVVLDSNVMGSLHQLRAPNDVEIHLDSSSNILPSIKEYFTQLHFVETADNNLDINNISQIAPDLIIISEMEYEKANYEILEKIAPVINLIVDPETIIQDVTRNQYNITKIFMITDPEIEEELKEFTTQFEQIQKSLEQNQQTALVISGKNDNILGYGKGSGVEFIYDLFNFSLADPQMSSQTTGGQAYGVSLIKNVNPDYIFVLDEGEDSGLDLDDKIFDGVSAIEDNQVIRIKINSIDNFYEDYHVLFDIVKQLSPIVPIPIEILPTETQE